MKVSPRNGFQQRVPNWCFRRTPPWDGIARGLVQTTSPPPPAFYIKIQSIKRSPTPTPTPQLDQSGYEPANNDSLVKEAHGCSRQDTIPQATKLQPSVALRLHENNVVVAFSSRARVMGECSTIYSPPALFFFKVEISLRTLSHSGSASGDDCDRVFPDELRVSSFPDRFPHYAWTAA